MNAFRTLSARPCGALSVLVLRCPVLCRVPVSGRVLGSRGVGLGCESGAPSGVQVTLSGGSLKAPLSVATGPDGTYAFQGLTPGKWFSIPCLALGFRVLAVPCLAVSVAPSCFGPIHVSLFSIHDEHDHLPTHQLVMCLWCAWDVPVVCLWCACCLPGSRDIRAGGLTPQVAHRDSRRTQGASARSSRLQSY